MVSKKSFTVEKLGDAQSGMDMIHIMTTTKQSTNYLNARFIDPGEGSTGTSHYVIEMEQGGVEYLETALTAFLQDKGYDTSLGKQKSINF
jgi:hypothetical protein